MFRFKTKRALIARNDELETIIAKQDAETASVKDAAAKAEARDEERIAQLQQSLNLADRAFDQLTEKLIEREAKFAAVVAELYKLRDEIRDAEQEQPVGIHPNLPSATGAGMARPPRPRFDRTAARLRQQGVPADLVDDEDGATC